MVMLRGPLLPGGACRRCGCSPGTPATPSSSRRCRSRRHHLGHRRQSVPRSVGRGSTSRTDRPLLRRQHLRMSSFARGRARTPGPRAADASVGAMETVLLLPGGGTRLHLLEQQPGGWGERRLDLVNGDRGAGAGGGPHPRTAPETALRWQGGRRGGGSDPDGDGAVGAAQPQPAAPAALSGRGLRVRSRRRPPPPEQAL
jgi:hypothetical protein